MVADFFDHLPYPIYRPEPHLLQGALCKRCDRGLMHGIYVDRNFTQYHSSDGKTEKASYR